MKIRILFDMPIHGCNPIPAGAVLETTRIFKPERPDMAPVVVADASAIEPKLDQLIVRTAEYTTDLTAPLAELQKRNVRSQTRKGYKSWIAEPARARSGEVDSGGWWALSGSREGNNHRWSVSWIENTGELYARNIHDDEYIVLAVTSPGDAKGADALLEGWADPDSAIYDNLQALFERLNPLPAHIHHIRIQ